MTIELTLPDMTCGHCAKTVTSTVLQVDPEERLVFLGLPGDPQGRPLFEVLNTLTFAVVPEGTRVTITTEVLALTPDIGVPHDGMAVGWNQSLDRLETLIK